MAEYAISGDVATLAGDDHTAGDPAALWIESSARILVDSTTGRIGGRLRVTLADDGTFSQDGLPETVGGAAPLYRLVVDSLSLRNAGHPRGITTNWFPLTADRDLTWIIDNYVETTTITTQLAAQIAAAAALGATNDSATASYVDDRDSATYDALATAFVRDPIAGINARLAASRRGPIKIVTLGSSTTEGVGATTANSRWVNQFARAVQAAYPSGVAGWEPPVPTLTAAASAVPTLPGVHVINGGAGGTTSASYCDSTALGQIDTVAPSIVVHMIGSNDHATDVTPATFATNLGDTIDDLDALVPDLIHVICDTFARADIDTPAHPWTDYIAQMKNVVNARPTHTVFVGQYAEWVEAQATGYDPVDPYRLTGWRIGAGGDIHPSDAGHALLAALVARGLRVPPVRPAPTPEVFDRFQRAAVGSAETGQPWVTQAGTFAVSGGYATVSSGGNLVVATGFSDCEVSALVTHNAAVVPGIICKSNDSSTRIGAFMNGPSDRVEIYVGTTIQGWTSALSLTSGREYFLKLTVSGNQATAELDGAKVLTVTLSGGNVTTYSGYLSHGIRCSVANAGVKWRNFAVRRI